jgi:hypothetical protein
VSESKRWERRLKDVTRERGIALARLDVAVAKAVAAEREACASLLESRSATFPGGRVALLDEMADTIRQRGKVKP